MVDGSGNELYGDKLGLRRARSPDARYSQEVERAAACEMSRYVLKVLDRFPPKLCRLIARRGRGSGSRAMSNAEIAEVSGLDRSTITKLSRLNSWATVKVSTMQCFSLACGVSLLRPSRHISFYLRGKLLYQKSGPPAQRRMLDRLQNELRNHT